MTPVMFRTTPGSASHCTRSARYEMGQRNVMRGHNGCGHEGIVRNQIVSGAFLHVGSVTDLSSR
jgi:hypothetical protein